MLALVDCNNEKKLHARAQHCHMELSNAYKNGKACKKQKKLRLKVNLA